VNSDIGHLAERRASAWFGDRVGLVPDRSADVPAQNCLDGVFLRPVSGDTAGELVPAGTPLEIKAAAFRTNDQDTSRRGRIQIRRYAHEWLLERDGEYEVLVYDPESLVWENDCIVDVEEWLARRLIPASTVDAVIETWTKDGLDDVARIPWSRLMDPERVAPDRSNAVVTDGGTISRSSTVERARRARHEPLTAIPIDSTRFKVRNLRSDTTYRVDLDDATCECEDYQYRAGPAGESCKHIHFIRQISADKLCSSCGYPTCRPSCPARNANTGDPS
jgi:hypothetical protein